MQRVDRRSMFRVSFVAALATIGVLMHVVVSGERPPAQRIVRGQQPSLAINERYGQIPMAFEKNVGQTAQPVRYVSRGKGYALFLTPSETVLSLSTPSSRAVNVLRMTFEGAKTEPQVVGEGELAGKSHYFRGNDPARWFTDVPMYSRVRYRDVYAGIDMVYYGNQSALEYDLVVSPGADWRAVRLAWQGADRLEMTPEGDVTVRVAAEEVRMQKPHVYQELDGRRQEVAAQYVLVDPTHLAFQLADYNATKPVVIDPVLEYSTYFGSGRRDQVADIAIDAGGSMYVTGSTNGIDFPIANAVQPISAIDPSYFDSHSDAFVFKLDPTGSAIAYSTFLGGTGNDNGAGIAVDPSGSAYVIGHTSSSNFPLVSPLQALNPGGYVYFVTKLNPAGSALEYSTYLGGGSPALFGGDIAVDALGFAYVTGAAVIPLVNPLKTTGGTFIGKLMPAGDAFVFSTQWDGTSYGIAVDPTGNIYVAGSTGPDFTTVNAAQPTFGGGAGFIVSDAFVMKVNAAGDAVIYATFLGGHAGEFAYGIATDPLGNAYVTGRTDAADFPVKNAFQPTGGFQDGFIAKYSPTGAVLYASYLGGSDGLDGGSRIAADAAGNAYVVGSTDAAGFPLMNPIQAVHRGVSNAFVMKVNATGSTILFSTFLGGGDEGGSGIAVDAIGNIYVAGTTSSEEFPTVNPIQPAIRGVTNVFVAKISDETAPSVTDMTPAAATQGETVSVTIHGTGFVAGSTGVAVSGSGITVGPITVMNPSTLTTTFTVDPAARADVRRVTVDVGDSAITNASLMVGASPSQCPVSLPVMALGNPINLSVRFGIGATNPTAGTWALGILTWNGSAVSVRGIELYTGGLPATPAQYYSVGDLIFIPPTVAVGVVNAYFTPDLCAYNVSFLPGIGAATASTAAGISNRRPLEGAMRSLKLNDFDGTPHIVGR